MKPIPCPFCGCKEIEVKQWIGETAGNGYLCVCSNMDCLAEGPFDLSKSGALKKWNKRYSPPVVERRQKGTILDEFST